MRGDVYLLCEYRTAGKTKKILIDEMIDWKQKLFFNNRITEVNYIEKAIMTMLEFIVFFTGWAYSVYYYL